MHSPNWGWVVSGDLVSSSSEESSASALYCESVGGVSHSPPARLLECPVRQRGRHGRRSAGAGERTLSGIPEDFRLHRRKVHLAGVPE